MAISVELTKPHRQALKREARREMENAIGERNAGSASQFHNAEEDRKQTKTLLACADVLAGLKNGERGPACGKDDPIEALFTDEAVAWMEEGRSGSERHIEELDRTGEGGYSYCCKEAFLIHTLNHVLRNAEGGQSS